MRSSTSCSARRNDTPPAGQPPASDTHRTGITLRTKHIDTAHLVVVNDEQQYSTWPTDRAVPLGWRPVGEPADQDSCLAYIERHWTDLRPLSARSAGSATAGSALGVPAAGRGRDA